VARERKRPTVPPRGSYPGNKKKPNRCSQDRLGWGVTTQKKAEKPLEIGRGVGVTTSEEIKGKYNRGGGLRLGRSSRGVRKPKRERMARALEKSSHIRGTQTHQETRETDLSWKDRAFEHKEMDRGEVINAQKGNADDHNTVGRSERMFCGWAKAPWGTMMATN